MLVSTGIFKKPVGRRLMLRRLNLDGDQQADLSVHGGPDKAVYAYPSEHYEFWGRELGRDLDWGMFGENFTLAGLSEDQVRIGDRYRIESAEVMVTAAPRPLLQARTEIRPRRHHQAISAKRAFGILLVSVRRR